MSKSANVRATIMWAATRKVNDLSGKYQMDLTNLSDNAVNALESLGLNVTFNDDKQHFVTCKSTRPFIIKDADGANMADVNIGNGSLAVANVGTFEWSFKNKRGISPTLHRLVITDLETFDEGEDEEDFDVDYDEAL